MKIKVFTGGNFFINSYILYNVKEAVIIDPGLPIDDYKSFIYGKKLTIKYIFLTHAHVDHILKINEVKDFTQAEICLHKNDLSIYNQAHSMAQYFGILDMGHPYPIDTFIEDGDVFEIDNQPIKVLHTPGHSPGSVCYYVENEFIITGDTLFNDGIGRTDLPGGSYKELINSITEKIFKLPDDLKIYPGHGPTSTIGYEKKNNPFI